MLKIGYFGDGPWAHEAFKRLIQDETVEIKFVAVRYDTQDPALIRLAEAQQIPIELNRNINSDEFMDKMKTYDVDLFVSMSFNQIFKTRMIHLPPYGTINCHAGKLPFYRGRNILNWALINDEKEFGITVHYVDEGIDTGDIILQRTYPITDQDDYRTLLDRAYMGCAAILYDAIKQIQHGKVNAVSQDSIDKIGMYCGIRRAGDEIIEWNSTSRQIFNFVRALCRPGPTAISVLNGSMMHINRVRLIEGAREYINIPGQILGKTQDGFYVKTKDTFIEVIECEYDGIIKIGDRFDTNYVRGRLSENSDSYRMKKG